MGGWIWAGGLDCINNSWFWEDAYIECNRFRGWGECECLPCGLWPVAAPTASLHSTTPHRRRLLRISLQSGPGAGSPSIQTVLVRRTHDWMQIEVVQYMHLTFYHRINVQTDQPAILKYLSLSLETVASSWHLNSEICPDLQPTPCSTVLSRFFFLNTRGAYHCINQKNP